MLTQTVRKVDGSGSLLFADASSSPRQSADRVSVPGWVNVLSMEESDPRRRTIAGTTVVSGKERGLGTTVVSGEERGLGATVVSGEERGLGATEVPREERGLGTTEGSSEEGGPGRERVLVRRADRDERRA